MEFTPKTIEAAKTKANQLSADWKSLANDIELAIVHRDARTVARKATTLDLTQQDAEILASDIVKALNANECYIQSIANDILDRGSKAIADAFTVLDKRAAA